MGKEVEGIAKETSHTAIKYVDAVSPALIRSFVSFFHYYLIRWMFVVNAIRPRGCMCEYNSNILMFDVFMVFTDRYLRNFTITTNMLCAK